MNTTDYSLLKDPEMEEIFESFLIESREILEKLDLDLVELENRPDDKELLNEIFRSFHTIKGTSGFLGLVKLQKVTHSCEDLLNKLRKGEATLNDNIMDGILNSYDTIKEMVDIIEEQKEENLDTTEILKVLDSILKSLENGSEDELSSNSEVKHSEEIKSQNDNNEDSPDEKPETEVVENEIETVEIPKEEKAEPEVSMRTQSQETIKNIQSKKSENTIRVDVERLDDLLNIVSELVLGRNRLMQVNSEATLQYEGSKISQDLAETSRQIDLMTTELQLSVMKTRMIKIGKVFNKFPRLVRDLSKETGKEIQLVIEGEETELDKTLIEEINDPLVHLVRNSADHGVELPEEREAAGKAKKGTIKLSAEQEGNNIVIKIEDDGKGIDPEKLKEKAVSKGLITSDRARELSKQDAFNLIFLPGFSTAEKITNVSGRGVGMDVVKTNVTKLRGIISVESEVGKGSSIIIKLPLTLAIIQGLLVKVLEETIVLPLNSVIEVVRVPKNKINTINQKEVIKLRDRVLKLINIDMLLYNMDTTREEDDWQYIVVLGIAEKRLGVKVDSLIGQKEVVIKSLGSYLGNIDGIAGSTILGDGKVVMIADIAELINKVSDI